MKDARGSIRLTRRAFGIGLLVAARARALMRPKFGGTLRMKLPLALSELDPHLLDDPAAALFAPAVFDTLFALDANGKAFPALAAALPEDHADGARVKLRPGLKTALGRPLSTKDIVFALERSSRHGGAAWLSRLPLPKTDTKLPDTVIFPGTKAAGLGELLASPITAIVPRGFNRLRPDGTGAFRAMPSAEGMHLTRNENAARGPALLQTIRVQEAHDLADALRAFETGEVDVGWLGKGLHRPRTDAKTFEAGHLGWVVLHSGTQALAWGRPGVTQRLLDELPLERFRHLGLRGPSPASTRSAWGGPSGQILVDGSCPQLVEIAASLAALLSRPDHELSAAPLPRQELRARRRSKQFLLMLDFVRRFSPSAKGTVDALYAAADPALAKNPPKLLSDARTIARTLTLGVVGELHGYGAYAPSLVNLERWDLPDAWLNPD